MKGLRRSALMVFLLLLLMNFNNCGVYETPTQTASDFTSLSCQSETDCVTESNLNLKIEILPQDNFPVNSALEAFNIGGNCNEAGFQNHQISWQLLLNGAIVRHSGMLMRGKTWNTTCVNGKYRLFVDLASTGEDPVDRRGLKYGAGAGRAAYDLRVEISAQSASGGWVRNTSQGGTKTITLVPL